MLAFTLIAVVSVYAVDSGNKPDTHTTAWEWSHGNAAKANEAECLSCHEERLECIACHEDMAPRNHTATWVRQNHGLESRWNRTVCATCHKEDFCSACHEEAMPRSHMKAGFRNGTGSHCGTSCNPKWTGSWQQLPAKNCITCHKTKPLETHWNPQRK